MQTVALIICANICQWKVLITIVRQQDSKCVCVFGLVSTSVVFCKTHWDTITRRADCKATAIDINSPFNRWRAINKTRRINESNPDCVYCSEHPDHTFLYIINQHEQKSNNAAGQRIQMNESKIHSTQYTKQQKERGE